MRAAVRVGVKVLALRQAARRPRGLRRRGKVGANPAGHEESVASYVGLVSAASSAVIGFDLCARRTRDKTIAVAAENAAASLRSLVEATTEIGGGLQANAAPRARTGERLRWEWLASTAMVVDGAAEGRLLSECARILGDAVVHTRASVDPTIAARFRVASAEAFSLAHTVEMERASSSQRFGGDLLPILAPI
jgi:hypothetical protein